MSGEGHYADMIKQQFNVATKKYNLNKDRPKLNSSLFTRDGQVKLF
jgi:hypothetical protein